MSQKGNFYPNPYIGGVPGWGESPMSQRGPNVGGQPGFWGQRGPSPHGGRGLLGQGPSPRQSPRGQFSPMYSSSPFMQQTPHQPHRMNHRGGNGSPRFQQFGGRNSGGGQFTSPRRYSQGQGNNSRDNESNSDISAYYKHSMVEDPWKDLIATPVTMGTT